MPILPRRKINIEGLEPEEGFFKKVYPLREGNVHSDDVNKVIKVYDINPALPHLKENISDNYIKADFFLTKIMKLLYPENIPNIHMAAGGNFNQTINERVCIDSKKTARFQDLTSEARGRFADQLEKDGIYMDRKMDNYVINDEGKMVYLDSFDPWMIVDTKKGVLIKTYDAKKLQQVINNRLPISERRKALQYLKRLEDLYVRECKERKKKKQILIDEKSKVDRVRRWIHSL